jgi:hypothetical protein
MGAEEREAGTLEERCAGCGDCLLALTGGICPVARCAKGLLNCSCGGSRNGKCELDPEKDCAWVKIYDRLNELGVFEIEDPVKQLETAVQKMLELVNHHRDMVLLMYTESKLLPKDFLKIIMEKESGLVKCFEKILKRGLKNSGRSPDLEDQNSSRKQLKNVKKLVYQY